jgi:hypothetical protein
MPKRPNPCRRWCFTLNNLTWEEIKNIHGRITPDNCVFAKIGQEVGDNGTVHLQGFVHLKTRTRLPGFKALASDRIYAEMARDTDQENDEYCSKDGTVILGFGQPAEGTTEKGEGDTARHDVAMAASELARHGDILRLYQQRELGTAYTRHSRVVEKLADAQRSAAAADSNLLTILFRTLTLTQSISMICSIRASISTPFISSRLARTVPRSEPADPAAVPSFE